VKPAFALLLVLLAAPGCGGGTDGAPKSDPPLFTRASDNAVYKSSVSAWNFAGIGDPMVLYDAGAGLWKMWTSAGGIIPSNPGSAIVRTQYLTSPDGIAWTEYGTNPVLTEGQGPSDWDRGGVETVCVLKDGSQYWMWYAGYDARRSPPIGMKIGVATSTDGIAWVKSPFNPVLAPGLPGSWDDGFVESPTVVKLGSTFYMWYSGISVNSVFRIGLATSSDGVAWTKHLGNPVLSTNPAASWESGVVYAPSVLHDGTRFRMWYVGLNASTFLNAIRIGMATSGDGMTWTRSASSPVLDLGASGAWDEKGCFVPTVVLSEGMYRMWYVSGSNPDEKVGLATWTP